MGVNVGRPPRIWVIGASGYIGSRLLAAAARQGEAYGTSTRGGNGLLAVDLQAPAAFDYAAIAADDVVIVCAAVSSRCLCQ
jgi:nucleoside-diphosphate-sugar epimerase